MIKATLLLVLGAGLLMGCTSNSTSMNNSKMSPMLQQVDYQPEPSRHNDMNDNNGSSPKVAFIRYPLIDL